MRADEMIRCRIPVDRIDCEEKHQKCSECPCHDTCDYVWINNLWQSENKLNKTDSLLGPAMPIVIKTNIRQDKVISVTGKYDFCCFNVPRRRDVVVIGDIYVDDRARGQGISRQILDYLMETYDRDIFAKCVRGSSAEAFWKHVGEQVDANGGGGPDLYEHPIGANGQPKRDLGWYMVKNDHKKQKKAEFDW